MEPTWVLIVAVFFAGLAIGATVGVIASEREP